MEVPDILINKKVVLTIKVHNGSKTLVGFVQKHLLDNMSCNDDLLLKQVIIYEFTEDKLGSKTILIAEILITSVRPYNLLDTLLGVGKR